MKARELERFVATYLSPLLPDDVVVQKDVLFRVPIKWLLHVVFLERYSGPGRGFRAQASIQPLYVPTDGFVLTLAEPIGAWNLDDERAVAAEIAQRVRDRALPAFAAAATPTQYLERRGVYDETPEGNRVQEDSAYSLVLAGQNDEACEVLQLYVAQIDEIPLEAQFPWMPASRERATLLLRALDEDNHAAVELLAKWRRETLDALGLAKWAATEPGES